MAEQNQKFIHRTAGFAEKTLYEALLYGAAIDSDAPAFLYKGQSLKFRAFVRLVDKTAAALLRAGVKEGDVVSLTLPNMPKAAAVLYAVNKIGAVTHLNHVLEPAERLEKTLRETGSKVLFTLDTNVVPYAEFCKRNGVRLISCCPADELGAVIRTFYRRREKLTREKRGAAEDFFAFIKGAEAAAEDFVRRGNQSTSVLINSGGTTGTPKTIEISDKAINFLSAEGPRLIETDRLSYRYMMSPLPIFHSFGLIMGLNAMTIHGGCNVFMPKFSRRDTLRYLKKGQINYMLGVPAVYEALLSRPEFSGKRLTGVEIAFVGGDVLRAETKERFDNRMRDAGSRARLMQGYGLSETLSVACVNTHEECRTGSVGRPVGGVKIRVGQTPDAFAFLEGKEHGKGALSGIPCGAQAGELLISGETLMNGYYRDGAATAEAVRTDGDGTGWLYTGDLGAVDGDGYVYFLERIKRIVKVSGESVFPAEIEAAVTPITGVAACAAFGIPDERTGNRVVLAVEPSPGANRNKLSRTIREMLGRTVQEKALPKSVEFLDELPRTKMMKIDTMALSALYAKKESDEKPYWLLKHNQ